MKTLVINPINKRNFRVFIKIELTNDGRLSISGVEGPLKSGNCLGGCGQIDIHLKTEDPSKWIFTEGWDLQKMQKLLEIWDKWHLNDMRSACEHQRSRGETWQKNPSAVCPDCGYRLGSTWLKEEVPQEIIEWLFALPETTSDYAWI